MSDEIRIKLERIDPVEKAKADPLLASSELIKRAGPELLRDGTAMRLGPKATLFHQGDFGSSLFFVLFGQLHLYAVEGSDGVELGSAGPGDVVGEAQILSGPGKRCCTATARGTTDVIEIPPLALRPALAGLLPWLKELHQHRLAKLREVTDFLKRW